MKEEGMSSSHLQNLPLGTLLFGLQFTPETEGIPPAKDEAKALGKKTIWRRD